MLFYPFRIITALKSKTPDARQFEEKLVTKDSKLTLCTNFQTFSSDKRQYVDLLSKHILNIQAFHSEKRYFRNSFHSGVRY